MEDISPTHRPIKVAVTYSVCQQWRAPIFKRLSETPGIELKVFHGEDLPGTKLINAKDFKGLPHQQLKTFHLGVRSSGREIAAHLYPGVVLGLFSYRPDVLLCEGGSNIFNNFLIYAYAAVTGTPTIWWTLGELPGRRFSGIGRLYRAVRDMLMRRSTVLLGYSSRAMNFFRRQRCRQPAFIAVNCIDTDRAFNAIEQARASGRDVRQELGLSDKKVLLFVGALTGAKRLDDLLKAYRRLRDHRDDVGLVMVGDGEAKAELEKLAADLALPDVHFTGRVIDGVSRYFLAADLFVLPGLGGLAISEAMCHALPVICTVADGCEEDLIERGSNGYILPEGDIETLAGTIDRLLDDPEALAAMGQRSLEIIQTRHNVNSYFAGIVRAIRTAHALRRSRLWPIEVQPGHQPF
jgi:glycosyltransferase involved in cell wall biosynthesis